MSAFASYCIASLFAVNLWGQDLSDVSVLSQMPNVEVLSLSVNQISTLRDFRNCTRLQELYMRKNQVRESSADAMRKVRTATAISW
jgi:Leucine-rich repeat (LRR) protein